MFTKECGNGHWEAKLNKRKPLSMVSLLKVRRQNEKGFQSLSQDHIANTGRNTI